MRGCDPGDADQKRGKTDKANHPFARSFHGASLVHRLTQGDQKMNLATRGTEGSASAPVWYRALELSNKTWRLALSDGAKRRQVTVPAADLVKLAWAVTKAKERFGMPTSARVVSCYEAGREAERAGARALVVFMHDWPRNGAEWKALRKIHEDEAHNCGLIGEQLKKRGKDYSHATGEFYDKAVAVKGARERIGFLVRGLKWAIREFEQALPRISDA